MPPKRIIVILALFVATTSFAYAAGLVPCGGEGQSMCRACDFVSMGQKILEWFIMTAASIIALMFAFGGMKMVMSAGNTGKVSEAKEMMTNSVIGFFILLGAWLIINTVLMTVMSDGKGIEVWGKIECVDNPTMSATNTGTGSATNTGTGSATNTGTAGKLTDTAARDLLTAAGITVNKTSAQGTSLEGINEATIQDAIDLKTACPTCNIVITGGTETTGGHAVSMTGHTSGSKYDIRLDPTLNTYITTTFTPIGTRSDGAAMYKATDGTIYAKEGDHWDVQVKG